MKAVIDRIENNIAVVLLGDEEIPVNIPWPCFRKEPRGQFSDC